MAVAQSISATASQSAWLLNVCQTALVQGVLETQVAQTISAVIAQPVTLNAPDEDDMHFVEVVVGGQADALVTGNVSHFATVEHIAVMTPANFLEFWKRMSTER